MSSQDSTSAGGQTDPAPAGRHVGERLEGWKSIAGYLDRDIRTVQRWEASEQLPVHRLEHRQRASAYAFTGELDEWVARRIPSEGEAKPAEPTLEPAPDPIHEPIPARAFWLSRPALIGAVLAAIIAVGALGVWILRSPGKGSVGDTRDPQAYSAFAEGRALYTSRQYRDAAIALERAVSRDTEYGLAWAWLAKTYGRLSQPMWTGGKAASDRAAETAERAARLIPGIAETHVALALAARSRGEVPLWRAEAHRAITLDPRSAEAYGLLGDSYSAYVYACDRDQDPALADSYYSRAMEYSPSHSIAASNRAHNLRRMGRYAECVELMNRTAKEFPDVEPILAERGACRLLAGDVEGASADILPLRGSPRLAPAGSLVYLGLLELKTGQTDAGIRDLEAALQLGEQGPRAELVVAETYGLGGDIPRAVVHLKRAFNLDRTCAGAVDKGIAFAPIRQSAGVKALLAQYGIR